MINADVQSTADEGRLRVFLDTTIVNRILDIEEPSQEGSLYEEDRFFLKKILETRELVQRLELYVNPSVKMEIEATKNDQRREELLKIFNSFKFILFTTTVFPIVFPATFLSEEEKLKLMKLCEANPSLVKDEKIIADAAFCQHIDVLLTTDRRHLANRGVCIEKLKICTPKELFDCLSQSEEPLFGWYGSQLSSHVEAMVGIFFGLIGVLVVGQYQILKGSTAFNIILLMYIGLGIAGGYFYARLVYAHRMAEVFLRDSGSLGYRDTKTRDKVVRSFQPFRWLLYRLALWFSEDEQGNYRGLFAWGGGIAYILLVFGGGYILLS